MTPSCAGAPWPSWRPTTATATPSPPRASTPTSGAGTPGRSPWAGPRPGDGTTPGASWNGCCRPSGAPAWCPTSCSGNQDDTYFPGPDVWATGHHPPTTGLTQPPLPVSAAARLFATDPDRDRATTRLRALWPRLLAWLAWIGRARRGPHGACVVVHPWESGMDNSPSWDQPLSRRARSDQRPSRTPGRRHRGRQTTTLHPRVPPVPRHRRSTAGRRVGHRAPGRRTARSRSRTRLSPPSRPGRLPTWPTSRPSRARRRPPPSQLADAARAGLDALWDDRLGWFRPYDLRHPARRSVPPPRPG